MRRRAVLLLAVAAILPALPAFAQTHWLVGRWVGVVQGLSSEKGNQRTLTVRRVNADGSVVGGWASPGRGLGAGARITVSGETVTVLTSDANTVTLSRAGANQLSGTFISTGGANRSYPVTLTRR